MPAPRHTRTLLVALLVAALGLGVATPSQAKEPSAERKARAALQTDRKAATKDGEAPAVVTAHGVLLNDGGLKLMTRSANLAKYRGAKLTLAYHDDAFVTLNRKPIKSAGLIEGDRVKVTALPVNDTTVRVYLAKAERRNPKPTKLQGKVTKIDPLTIFARGMDQKISVATATAVVERDRKPVSATNAIAVGDRCSVAGFPASGGIDAFYLSCKSTPPAAKGKPAK